MPIVVVAILIVIVGYIVISFENYEEFEFRIVDGHYIIFSGEVGSVLTRHTDVVLFLNDANEVSKMNISVELFVNENDSSNEAPDFVYEYLDCYLILNNDTKYLVGNFKNKFVNTSHYKIFPIVEDSNLSVVWEFTIPEGYGYSEENPYMFAIKGSMSFKAVG